MAKRRRSNSSSLVTAGVVTALVVGGVYLATRSDRQDTSPAEWDAFLFTGPNTEDRQAIFHVLASLYGRGLSEAPPSVARIEAIRTSGDYDAEAKAALTRGLGRRATGTNADLLALFRLPALPESQIRALPFFVSDAVNRRMIEIDREIQRSLNR